MCYYVLWQESVWWLDLSFFGFTSRFPLAEKVLHDPERQYPRPIPRHVPKQTPDLRSWSETNCFNQRCHIISSGCLVLRYCANNTIMHCEQTSWSLHSKILMRKVGKISTAGQASNCTLTFCSLVCSRPAKDPTNAACERGAKLWPSES